MWGWLKAYGDWAGKESNLAVANTDGSLPQTLFEHFAELSNLLIGCKLGRPFHRSVGILGLLHVIEKITVGLGLVSRIQQCLAHRYGPDSGPVVGL